MRKGMGDHGGRKEARGSGPGQRLKDSRERAQEGRRQDWCVVRERAGRIGGMAEKYTEIRTKGSRVENKK